MCTLNFQLQDFLSSSTFPRFHPLSASWWFDHLERKFEEASVHSQNDRYYCLMSLLAHLQPELTQVRIKLSPNLYADAKAEIIRLCRLYGEAKTIQSILISPLQQCKKPSHVLAIMHCYAFRSIKVEEKFWKQFFLSVLPQPFQLALEHGLSSGSNIFELAVEADKMYDRFFEIYPHRPYVFDRISGMWFLIDTGSAVSIIPPVFIERVAPTYACGIEAANGNPIAVYGRQYLILDFDVGELFLWNFLVADVTSPILGTDFLIYFDFNFDFKYGLLARGALYSTALNYSCPDIMFQFSSMLNNTLAYKNQVNW